MFLVRFKFKVVGFGGEIDKVGLEGELLLECFKVVSLLVLWLSICSGLVLSFFLLDVLL